MEPWRFLKPQMWDDLFTPQAAWIEETGLVDFIKLKLKAMDVELVRKATQGYDSESKTIHVPELGSMELSDKSVGEALCLPYGSDLEEIPTEYNSQLHGPEIQKYFSEKGHSQASGWKLCEVKEHVMRVYLEFLVKRIGLRLNNQRVSGATAYPACATRSTKKIFNWAQFVVLKMHKELKEGKPVTTAHYLSMVLQHHFDLPGVDLQPTMRFATTGEQSGKRKRLSWEDRSNERDGTPDEDLIVETLRQGDELREVAIRPCSSSSSLPSSKFVFGESSGGSRGGALTFCSMQQKQVLSAVDGILKQMKQTVIQQKEALISSLWQAQQAVAQLETPERSLDFDQLSARYAQLQQDYRSVCHQRDVLLQQVTDLQDQFRASDELHSQRLEEANERLAKATRKLTEAKQANRAKHSHSTADLHESDCIMEYGFSRSELENVEHMIIGHRSSSQAKHARFSISCEDSHHGRGNASAEAVSSWLFATSAASKGQFTI
ncbi:uncharacterized protein LOC9637904 [Selaginella moellendorffii]|uniref:uncharacterized protein LOC9637904 n=1 Tax=Selaginella moellendorffii TaxID=88036 RepID=UPI000D1CE4DE|nr:uncharacterized protein LOC9637904 [Selaginella moellendorffii]XP_024534007.1 uncharacterized protein LOC9637904 [Selaginella moellendorffii]XP_024534008.1 uncharacterized protein LOC9637904 [Selaginella moellendorffii]|eukprot:XP_024534006.1 uncharacterized protein LOC9637904 [Selaginella moellendorffii]